MANTKEKLNGIEIKAPRKSKPAERENESSSMDSNSTFRTMRIIEELSLHPDVTLDEIAPSVSLSRPTVFRFLQVLQKMDYVEKNKDNRYSLTPKLFSVASRSLPETELSKIAQPYMEDMSYRTGETSILSILDGNSAMYLVKIESKYNLKFYERPGKKIPLYCSVNKILLSGMDDEALNRYFASEQLIPYTANTVTDEQKLRSQLKEIREKGFAITESEYESGHRAIGVPIFGVNHSVIASLSLTWPMFRDTSEKLINGLEYLQKVGKQISILMGCTDL